VKNCPFQILGQFSVFRFFRFSFFSDTQYLQQLPCRPFRWHGRCCFCWRFALFIF